MTDKPRRVFWLGAGISIAAPTSLPAAPPLVGHWLNHLLPKKDAEYLLALYRDHKRLLDKPIPRLEKLVEDAVAIFGEPVLELLCIFRNRLPNANHRMVADYLTQHRGWAVTTNFDTAIEVATGGTLPVHTPMQDSTESWGLIKLHGSIDEALPQLGHSIRNLVHGLAPHLARRIGEALDQADGECVFAGYSSSDYFDVVPYFDAHKTRPFATRALWIDHAPDVPHEATADSLPEGAKRMLAAFSAVRVLRGDTAIALATKLATDRLKGTSCPWWEGWEARFAPKKWQQHLYAAKLYASLGIGRHSLNAARLALASGAPDGMLMRQFIANGLRDCGRHSEELAYRHNAAPPLNSAEEKLFWQRQEAAGLRLARHSFASWRAYKRLVEELRQCPHTEGALADEQVWCLVEAAMLFRDGLLALPRIGLLRPLASYFKGRIRRLLDEARLRFPSSARNPHVLALIHRMEFTLAHAPGGLPAGYYYSLLRDGIQPPLRGADEQSFEPDSLYRETDSLLGMVNAARDSAREHLARRRTTRPENHALLCRLARRELLYSWRLAKLIEDRPGMTKACRMLVQLADGAGCRRLRGLARRYAARQE